MDVFSPSDMPQLMTLEPRKDRSVRTWCFIFAANHMPRIRKALVVVLEEQMDQIRLHLVGKQTSAGAHLLAHGLMHLSVVELLLATICWHGCMLNPGKDEVAEFTGVNF